MLQLSWSLHLPLITVAEEQHDGLLNKKVCRDQDFDRHKKWEICVWQTRLLPEGESALAFDRMRPTLPSVEGVRAGEELRRGVDNFCTCWGMECLLGVDAKGLGVDTEGLGGPATNFLVTKSSSELVGLWWCLGVAGDILPSTRHFVPLGDSIVVPFTCHEERVIKHLIVAKNCVYWHGPVYRGMHGINPQWHQRTYPIDIKIWYQSNIDTWWVWHRFLYTWAITILISYKILGYLT